MTDEWGPWIEHDGKHIPPEIRPGVYIATVSRMEDGGCVYNEGRIPLVSLADWHEGLRCFLGGSDRVAPVIRYRILRPRGLTILQDLLADLPKRVDA